MTNEITTSSLFDLSFINIKNEQKMDQNEIFKAGVFIVIQCKIQTDYEFN